MGGESGQGVAAQLPLEQVRHWIELTSLGIELLAITIIVLAIVYGTLHYLYDSLHPGQPDLRYEDYKRRLKMLSRA